MRNTFSNIILIGMAGAGKSTVGAVLADLAKKQFIDTDDLISEQTGMPLQDFLNSVGQETFQHQEEQALVGITLHDHVIATGGSVVYSSAGMRHLQKLGPIVLLEVDLKTLEQRVHNKDSRGLINPGKGSFRDLFYSRQPLYQRWADIRINGSGPSEEVARSILKKLAETKNS